MTPKHLERFYGTSFWPKPEETSDSFPTSVKVVGEIYYSPRINGWVVDLAGTGETVNIFATRAAAMAWVGNLLR